MKSGSKWIPTAGAHIAIWAICLTVVLSAVASAKEYSVRLEYAESPEGITHQSFDNQVRSTPFRKEPPAPANGWQRGTLQLSGALEPAVGYLWDIKGNLQIDGNRNEDLTDDGPPYKAQHAYSGGNYTYCSFTNVHFPSGTNFSAKPLMLDLNLNLRNQRTDAYGRLKSFRAGKLELDGKTWQIGVVTRMQKASRPAIRDNMVVRPWTDRGLGFSTDGQDPTAFQLPQNLYLQNKWFRLSLQPDAADLYGGTLRLVEEPVILGDLAISGEHISHLLLQSSNSAVILGTPAKLVKLPVGTYSSSLVQVGSGQNRAFRETNTRGQKLVVQAGSSATLRIGGPLTNTVTATRRGPYLSLDYNLVGADGVKYAFVGTTRDKPPSFKIESGGQKVASGNFQYG